MSCCDMAFDNSFDACLQGKCVCITKRQMGHLLRATSIEIPHEKSSLYGAIRIRVPTATPNVSVLAL